MHLAFTLLLWLACSGVAEEQAGVRLAPSACHRACLLAKCHQQLWGSEQHCPSLPEGSWQVPARGTALVLPWCRTACSFTGACALSPAEQLVVDRKAAFSVSSSGIHADFETLCLGLSSVDFSVPPRLKAVTLVPLHRAHGLTQRQLP